MQQNQDMMEIDLKELFFILLRRWYLIAICFVVASGIAFYVSYFYLTPVYEAETSLFLGKEKDSVGALSFMDMETNSQLIADYRELIKSRMVSEQVIADMGLDMDWETFVDRVSITVLSDSRLFKIAFKSSNPQLAADVTNQLAQVIMTKAADVINVKNIQVIDTALVPTVPVEPQKSRNVMMAALLGIMAGVGIIFLMEFMDHTFKKPEDVERLLGLPVLGTVPKFAGEKREKEKKHHRKKHKKATGNTKSAA